MNNSITFQKELLGVQDDLLRFAFNKPGFLYSINGFNK